MEGGRFMVIGDIAVFSSMDHHFLPVAEHWWANV